LENDIGAELPFAEQFKAIIAFAFTQSEIGT
jgi:hypothetical protein